MEGTDYALLSPCAGRYCGRTILDAAANTTSTCGACPRAHRTLMAGGVCVPCHDFIGVYDTFFLVFQVSLLLLLHIDAVDTAVQRQQMHHRTRERRGLARLRLMLLVSVVLELIVASLAAALLTQPLGRVGMYACTVHHIADFYPWLHNPLPPCGGGNDCANEAAYPLVSWVLLVDGFGVLAAVSFRRLVNVVHKAWATKGAAVSHKALCSSIVRACTRSTLYTLPMHAALHVLLVGVVYYAFSFALVIGGCLIMTGLMAFIAHIDQRDRILALLVSNNYRSPILVTYLMMSIGMAAMVSLVATQRLQYIAGYVLGPALLPFVFKIMERRTHPDVVVTQLRYLHTAH